MKVTRPQAPTAPAAPATAAPKPAAAPAAAAKATGWLGAAKAPLDNLLHDAAGAMRFLGLKGAEVVSPQSFEADDDKQIARMADAIRRHDEPAVAEILNHAGPRLAAKLWEADLPQWVPADKYLDTLKTGPNEAWKVNWSYDFDTPKAAGELARLAPPLKGLLDVLTHVRKNFPAGANTNPAQLTGATTFGYDPAKPGSGQVTPNTIRMTTSTNERTGKQMPVALMTYSKEPWFDQKSGVGFNDEFKALTPNIILAKGRIAEYTDADLHGEASGQRPWLSKLLSTLSGGQREGVTPQATRFWMQRSGIDPQETAIRGSP